MLETSEERARLLKAGVPGKDIERLYIIYNNFKIIGLPLLCMSVGNEEKEHSSATTEASAEYDYVLGK